MNRLILYSLTLLFIAPALAANEPPSCRQWATSGKDGPPIGEFLGDLPIQDYFDVAESCTSPGKATSDRMWSMTAYSGGVPRPDSEWITAQMTLYSDVLAHARADLLIVPMQVQGKGFDRIERALMTADLAYSISTSTGMSVADPFLVDRALGEGRRRIDPLSVNALAQRLGVNTVITAYAGHDGKHRFTLTIVVSPMAPPVGGLPTSPMQKDWRNITFTDQQTPALILHRMLPGVVESLRLKTIAMPAIAQKKFEAALQPGPPIQLATTTSPAAACATLDLLGAFTSSAAEQSRERLFERSLIAALNQCGDDARGRFYEAYALMYLQRRPAAIAAIEGSKDPAAAGLRSLLDGDLPSAIRNLGRVKDPLPLLLLQLSVRDLQLEYGKDVQIAVTAAQKYFGASYPDWRALVDTRSGDLEHWSVAEPLTIKKLLDDSFPHAGISASSLIRGSAVARDSLPDDIDLDLSIARHIHNAVASAVPDRCCGPTNLAPSRWDLLWVLEGLSEGRLYKSLMRTIVQQALPKRAMAQVNRYEALFKGHPLLALAQAAAATKIAANSPDDERLNWLELRNRGAELAAYHAQGESRSALLALQLMGLPGPQSTFLSDVYGYDYPRRAYWPPWILSAGAPVTQRISLSTESLAYSTNDISPIEQLVTGGIPFYNTVVSQLGSRFTGHPQRPATSAPAANATPAEQGASMIAALRKAISEEPPEWLNYFGLGNALIATGGSYEEASKIFLSYPGFHGKTSIDPVALSNYAYDAGTVLYWQGQPDLARPLYQVAADLDTGSAASMSSQHRLQLLDGEYEAAAELALERAVRYSTPFGYRDYFSLLHVLGHGDDAWSGFSQVMADFDEPHVWLSALVGQRMASLDAKGFESWIARPEIAGAKFRSLQFAPYYALLWNSIDRLPPHDLGAQIERIEGPPAAHASGGGTELNIPSRRNLGGFEIVRPSAFRAGVATHLAPGTGVKSDLAFFADAYAALRHQAYADATDRFLAMADRYPIERQTYTYALPYFAFAAAKSGDKVEFEKFIAGLGGQPNFDVALARAFFAAAHKNSTKAKEELTAAFRVKPYTGYRPIFVEYQYAEACEWIYQETGDLQIRALLLDWVKAYQRIQPTQAWAYAMQFNYDNVPAERLRALAMTLYLDPATERISGASPAELDAARQWLRKRNPFRRTDEPAQRRAT